MSCPLADIKLPFCVHSRVPKWPQNEGKNSIKTSFLVVLDHFSLKNGSNNLVRDLFLSLDIGPYFPATCGSLSTFLVPLGATQMAPKWKKN
jgi:hypothetical protein